MITLILGAAGLAACQRDEEDNADSAQYELGGINRIMLDAVVDTIVPKDQDPGAVEAGVTDSLLELFDQSEHMRQHANAMLSRAEVVAQHKYHKPFHRLGLKRREGILHRTLHSRHKDDQAASRAISVLRGHVIEAFYESPIGQSVVGYYPPYPGGYPDYHIPPPT